MISPLLKRTLVPWKNSDRPLEKFGDPLTKDSQGLTTVPRRVTYAGMSENRNIVARQPANPLPDHGPAYGALTEQQQRWLDEYIINGGKATDAALAAGYGSNSPDEKSRKQAARIAGYDATRNHKILDAMNEEAGLRLRLGGILGINVMFDIANDIGHKDRYKAAKELMGHNGFQLITEQKITVVQTKNEAEKVQDAVEMALKLGIDPRQLLGKYGYVVDADFKVIAGPVEGQATPSDKGLEDILYGDPEDAD